MTRFTVWIRSWSYLIAFLAWTTSAALILLPALVRRDWALGAIRLWVRGIMVLARAICA